MVVRGVTFALQGERTSVTQRDGKNTCDEQPIPLRTPMLLHSPQNY